MYRYILIIVVAFATSSCSSNSNADNQLSGMIDGHYRLSRNVDALNAEIVKMNGSFRSLIGKINNIEERIYTIEQKYNGNNQGSSEQILALNSSIENFELRLNGLSQGLTSTVDMMGILRKKLSFVACLRGVEFDQNGNPVVIDDVTNLEAVSIARECRRKGE